MRASRIDALEATASAVRWRIASLLGLTAREPSSDKHELALLRHRARLLARVACAAEQAAYDWESGRDVDDAMRALRAELRTAAEFSG